MSAPSRHPEQCRESLEIAAGTVLGEASKDGHNVALESGQQQETGHKKKKEERKTHGHMTQRTRLSICLHENLRSWQDIHANMPSERDGARAAHPSGSGQC